MRKIVDKLGLGEVSRFDDDTVITSSCIIHTVRDKKRVKALCRNDVPTIYCPHPYLAVRCVPVFTNHKQCTVLCVSGQKPTRDDVLSYIESRGYVVRRVVTDGSLSSFANVAERARFVLFDNVRVGAEAHVFVAAGVPFFKIGDGDICDSVRDSLRLCDCESLLSDNIDDVLRNVKKLSLSLSSFARESKDMMRQVATQVTMVRGKEERVHEVSEKQLILRPWVGYVSDLGDLDTERVRYSLTMCSCLLVSDWTLLPTVREKVPEVDAKLACPYVTPSSEQFDLEVWSREKGYSVVGKKSVVHLCGSTGAASIVGDIVRDTVVVAEHLSFTQFTQVLSIGAPLVTLRDENIVAVLGEYYPLFSLDVSKKSVVGKLRTGDVALARDIITSLQCSDFEEYSRRWSEK